MRKPTAAEQLTFSTVRLSCEGGPNGPSVGSGFFYTFALKEKHNVPSIVTNKHVVEGAQFGTFNLTLRAEDGSPSLGNHLSVRLDQFRGRWIDHPDPEIDLCAMPLAPLLEAASNAGKKFYFITLDEKLIPTQEELSDLSALEDILMVGYPSGLWDEVNNMPILRRGITATHARLQYRGRSEFLIDAACFPGSSGSPVFLFNEMGWRDNSQGIMLGGTRVKLLGVLYAGPHHTATGEVRIETIPSSQKMVAVSPIPNNLGLVIKSSRLQELDAKIIGML